VIETHQHASDFKDLAFSRLGQQVSDYEARITPGLSRRGIHIFSTARFK
jgi:hypothetical protein